MLYVLYHAPPSPKPIIPLPLSFIMAMSVIYFIWKKSSLCILLVFKQNWLRYFQSLSVLSTIQRGQTEEKECGFSSYARLVTGGSCRFECTIGTSTTSLASRGHLVIGNDIIGLVNVATAVLLTGASSELTLNVPATAGSINKH